MKKIIAMLTLSAFVISAPTTGYAVGSAGFENARYSAKTIGQANAVVARPQDPSTVVFNPAGLVDLPGTQINIGAQYIDNRIFHTNKLTGDSVKSDQKFTLLPTFYLSYNPGDSLPGEALDNRLAFGLGVNSPFGGNNSWPARDPFGVYGFTNWGRMVAVTAAAAAKVTDWFKIGGGPVYYNVFDYGQRFNYPNSFIVNTGGDGVAEVDTSGYSWGWVAGILVEPHPHHTFGFSYRSRTTVETSGQVEIDGIVMPTAQGFPTTEAHFMTGTSTEIPLPQSWTWAYAYEPSDDWAIEVDVNFTGWSDFTDQDYGFDFSNAVLRALGTVPRNYDNTWNFHIGGHKRLNDRFDLYGGFAFMQAASPKKHVDNFIPDGNRYQWAVGTTFSVTDNMDVDLSYFFELVARRNISNPQALGRTGVNIDGRYTSIIHGPAISLTYRFGQGPEEGSVSGGNAVMA